MSSTPGILTAATDLAQILTLAKEESGPRGTLLRGALICTFCVYRRAGRDIVLASRRCSARCQNWPQLEEGFALSLPLPHEGVGLGTSSSVSSLEKNQRPRYHELPHGRAARNCGGKFRTGVSSVT